MKITFALLQEELGQMFVPNGKTPCKQQPELFDPPAAGERMENGYAQFLPRHLKAIALCYQCPELDRCREWVLSRKLPDDGHVWGGLTEEQRNKILKRKRGSKPNRGRLPVAVVDLAKRRGGCRNGHLPDRRYRRPAGDLRCRECEVNYNRRRAEKLKAERYQKKIERERVCA